MEVRWTSMPPNGCAADRRTPGGKQGGGEKCCQKIQYRVQPDFPLARIATGVL